MNYGQITQTTSLTMSIFISNETNEQLQNAHIWFAHENLTYESVDAKAFRFDFHAHRNQIHWIFHATNK